MENFQNKNGRRLEKGWEPLHQGETDYSGVLIFLIFNDFNL